MAPWGFADRPRYLIVPGSLLLGEHVGETVARGEIDADDRGQGELGVGEGHADDLTGEGGLALPVALEEPRSGQIGDSGLGPGAASLREGGSRHRPWGEGLGHPAANEPLGCLEPGLALEAMGWLSGRWAGFADPRRAAVTTELRAWNRFLPTLPE